MQVVLRFYLSKKTDTNSRYFVPKAQVGSTLWFLQQKLTGKKTHAILKQFGPESYIVQVQLIQKGATAFDITDMG